MLLKWLGQSVNDSAIIVALKFLFLGFGFRYILGHIHLQFGLHGAVGQQIDLKQVPNSRNRNFACRNIGLSAAALCLQPAL